MRRAIIPLLAVLAAGCGTQAPPSQPTSGTSDKKVEASPVTVSKVELTPVTVAELEAAIASHKGKVVLIDCWFRTCSPCVKKFPRVVQLHRDFAKDGLVVMSLDVIPEEWDEKDKVLKFLTGKEATFPNYIFADKPKAYEAWQAAHDAENTPAFVAFDRQGKWVRYTEPKPQGTEEEKDAAHAEAERAFVKKLLAEK